jgi:hypothetical protein
LREGAGRGGDSRATPAATGSGEPTGVDGDTRRQRLTPIVQSEPTNVDRDIRAQRLMPAAERHSTGSRSSESRRPG